MPIYAYACAACGHTKDHLQKMADAPIAICPACGSDQYSKQLSAPQFQLKGGGWYVTDFRDNGNKDGKKSDQPAEGKDGANSGADSKADSGSTDAKTESKVETKTETKSETKTESKAAAPVPAPSSGSDAKAA